MLQTTEISPDSQSAAEPFKEQRFEQRIAGLEGHISNLTIFNRRFAWYRLAAFALGVAAVWLAAGNLSNSLTGLVFLAAAVLFGLSVALHRRLDQWIRRFEIWKEIQEGHLARLRRDWSRIPLFDPEQGEKGSLSIDLDLTGPRSLHHLIDLAVSEEGSRLLAAWLAQSTPDMDQIRLRQPVVRELAPMRRFRDRLLLNLRWVSKEQLKGRHLLAWLDAPASTGRLKWLLPVAALLVAANLALFLLNSFGLLPPYWPFTILLYMGFYFYNTGTLGSFLDSVVALDEELSKFAVLLKHLETWPLTGKKHLEQFCAPFRRPGDRPSRHLRRIKWVTAAVGMRMNPVIGLLLNIILPWDFLFAFLAERMRADAARLLPEWLDAWYQLEALISLANFADLNSGYVYPEIDPHVKPVFQAEGLGHPLILPERQVRNAAIVPDLGAVEIITGSNMAGKSTFIKTVGVNLCLAYAGGPVNAHLLRSRPFRLHTCIRITDSITDGFSYFYSEVKCLRGLLEELRSEHTLPLMYLIDEIFRGTNNRERLIGSRAFIQSLIGQSGVGFIATHDLELAKLAEQSSQVRNFHFRDQVENGRLVFDYLIRPGPSPTTNALKIMQLEGLPVDPESS